MSAESIVGSAHLPHRDQARLGAVHRDVDRRADLVDGTGDAPQPHLVDQAVGAVHIVRVAADLERQRARRRRPGFREARHQLAVDVVLARGAVRGHGDVDPLVAGDDAAVFEGRGATDVRPQHGGRAGVADAHPIGHDISLAHDAAAGLIGGRHRQAHPRLDGDGAGRVECRAVRDLEVAVAGIRGAVADERRPQAEGLRRERGGEREQQRKAGGGPARTQDPAKVDPVLHDHSSFFWSSSRRTSSMSVRWCHLLRRSSCGACYPGSVSVHRSPAAALRRRRRARHAAAA